MNNGENMSDQLVGEIIPSGSERSQEIICEDCGRVWIVECNNKDINLCLDKEKVAVIKKPTFFLTSLREKTDPLNEGTSLNSPARLTCMVMGPKDRHVYKYKVNHKGYGSAAYSGCKLDPYLDFDVIEITDFQSFIYGDESIPISEPLKKKRKHDWMDKSDMSTPTDGTINTSKNASSQKESTINSSNIEKNIHISNIHTIYSEKKLETFNNDMDNIGYEKKKEKSDMTNKSQFGINQGSAMKYEINEVAIKQEILPEETQDLFEAANLCTDQLNETAFLQNAKIEDTECRIPQSQEQQDFVEASNLCADQPNETTAQENANFEEPECGVSQSQEQQALIEAANLCAVQLNETDDQQNDNDEETEGRMSQSHKIDESFNYETYGCPECTEVFVDKWECIRHVRAHAQNQPPKELPFPCNVCGKSFDRRLFLEKHMKVHEYTCTVCNMEFNHKRKYLRHMQVHTGKKAAKSNPRELKSPDLLRQTPKRLAKPESFDAHSLFGDMD